MAERIEQLKNGVQQLDKIAGKAPNDTLKSPRPGLFAPTKSNFFSPIAIARLIAASTQRLEQPCFIDEELFNIKME